MASAAVLPRKPGTGDLTPRLRDATAADAAALARLYGVARPNAHVGAEEFAAWLTLNSALLVEEAGGAVVAALRYGEEGEGWRVEPIVTHPERRGRGYGRWLMTMLEADAIRSNVPFLALTLTDPGVLAYYQRLGYRPIGHDPLQLVKRVGGVWQRRSAS